MYVAAALTKALIQTRRRRHVWASLPLRRKLSRSYKKKSLKKKRRMCMALTSAASQSCPGAHKKKSIKKRDVWPSRLPRRKLSRCSFSLSRSLFLLSVFIVFSLSI